MSYQPYPSAQQPYPQQPYPHQFGMPPKKRRKWPWILAAIVVLLIVLTVSIGHSDSDKAAPTVAVQHGPDAAPAAAPAPDAGVGAQVRDGKFAFTVNSVKAGVTSVDDSFGTTRRAQGQFVLVDLTVANIGNEEQDFFAHNQKLIDTSGRQFDDDTMAEAYLPNNENAITSGINPGNSITTTVVFDLPVGDVPASMELHDSAFSGGAKVNLR